MIYFIGNKKQKLVKIGYTDQSIRVRFSTIQSNCPFEVEILLTIDGMRNTERHIHDIFKNAHYRGEWFKITPDIKAFISRPIMPYIEETFKSTCRLNNTNDDIIEDLYKTGLSLEKIAQQTGYTYSQVRTRVSRRKYHLKYKDIRSKRGCGTHQRTPMTFVLPSITKVDFVKS